MEMREIKFRVRCGDEICQVADMSWSYRHNLQDVRVAGVSDYYPAKSCTPIQYTGRKDKNGKEIYDGDIVNCRVAQLAGEPDIAVKSQLVSYDNKGNLKFGYYCAWFCYQEEVIGNKWENPELLELVRHE